MEIGEAEVLFAQKLADCDPGIRRKAFSRLQKWIVAREKTKNGFQRSELIILWKGLYYCMWMQDKPLLQEELADRLCSAGESFISTDQHILYLDTFLVTIAREWSQLDRWRVDKFMMLFRRFFRHTMAWLKSKNFDQEIWDALTQLYEKTVWTVDPEAYTEELKFHFASIYLDELDLAGAFALPREKIFQFLHPYINLLAANIGNLFFRTIDKEIFEAILIDFSENVSRNKKAVRKNKNIKLVDPLGSSGTMPIDYNAIAETLMNAAKGKSVRVNRRGVIYKLAKRFLIAASGNDPFMTSISIPKAIDDDDVEKAALKLVKWSRSKQKVDDKKKRKRQEESDSEPESEQESSSESEMDYPARSALRRPMKSRKGKTAVKSGLIKKRMITKTKVKGKP